MNPTRTLYTVLGVESSAAAAEIEAAFRAAMEVAEAAGGDADRLSLLRVAYDTLRNPDQRAAYDRRLARQQAVTAEYVDIAPRGAGTKWGWIAALALVAAGAGYHLQKRDPAPVAAQRVLAAAPHEEPAPLPMKAEAPAAPARQPEPEAAPALAVAHAAPEIVVPKRGAKKAGFDAEYVAWSVFTIRQSRSSGSGVLIAPDRILTNCHVLAGAATNGMVVIHSLTGKTTKVEKYARLDGEDACLVFAPGAGGEPIEWGSASELRQADTVHTFGHPGGTADVIWSEGKFLGRVERGREEFLFSANYCRPGSSGGPLLDDRGRLVGIVTAVQRYVARAGEQPQYGGCISVTEATAKALLARPLFPIALAPAQYIPNY